MNTCDMFIHMTLLGKSFATVNTYTDFYSRFWMDKLVVDSGYPCVKIVDRTHCMYSSLVLDEQHCHVDPGETCVKTV